MRLSLHVKTSSKTKGVLVTTLTDLPAFNKVEPLMTSQIEETTLSSSSADILKPRPFNEEVCGHGIMVNSRTHVLSRGLQSS